MKWLRCVRWLLTRGTRRGRQTCRDCYRNGREAIWFYVPDELWEAVMDRSQAVICLTCFDRRAEARSVNYGPVIEVQGRGSWLAGRYAATTATSEERSSERDKRASMVRSA